MNDEAKKIISAFYPYTNEFYSIDKYADAIVDFDVVFFITPPGITVPLSSHKITNTLPDENIDTLLLGYDSYYSMQFDKTYFKIIKEAIDRGINICFISDVSKLDIEHVLDYNQKHNNVKNSMVRSGAHYKNFTTDISPIIVPINCPVVFVTSAMEHTRKFEVELGLYISFLKKGYNVQLVASKPYAEIFGVFPFPNFMFNEALEKSKIINFNVFLKSIEYNTNPDLIIVGIPGTIMKFNNNIVNNFGITALEISRAVRPDIVVFNLNYDPNYDNESLECVYSECSHIFGVSPSCVCIADSQLDTSMVSNGVLTFLYASDEKVDELASSLTNDKRIVVPALSNQGIETVAEFMEDILSDDSVLIV